jgi:hypothetical protein
LSGSEIKTEVHGYIEVSHGLNDEGDYIWQFAQLKKQRPFPNDLRFFYDQISKGLDPLFQKVKWTIYPPPSDWEIKVIAVKAHGVGKLWSFDEEEMSKPLPKLCKVLNDYLDKLPKPKRKI